MLNNHRNHPGPSSFENQLNASVSPVSSSVFNPTYESPIYHLVPPSKKVAPGAPVRKSRHALLTFDENRDRTLYPIELNDPFKYLTNKLRELEIEIKFEELDLNEKSEHEKTQICVNWVETNCHNGDWKCYLSKAFTDKYCQ